MITEIYDAGVFSKSWDICIIGSGAMGIAMARKFAKCGKSVIMIEAGNEEISAEAQEFYACDSVGHPHDGASNGRFRVFGGSTERWGGQAMRFEREDFEPRKEIYPDGWPITADELSAYYEQAEEYMGVPSPDYSAFGDVLRSTSSEFKIDSHILENALKPFHLHYSVFTVQPRMREKYRAELDAYTNLLVLLKCSAERLHINEAGDITKLDVRVANNTLHKIHAQVFILACGCIENARFLMIQRDHFHLNALKELPMIGRCIQDHPGAHLGELNFTNGAFLQSLFRMRQRSNMLYKARMSWSGEKRKSAKLLAVSGTLLMMRRRSEYDPLDSRMRFGNLREWLGALRLLSKGFLYSPLHHTYLAVSAEDLRNRDSQISLSSTKYDANGYPHAVIDWRVSNKVAESIIHYTETFEQFLLSCNLGRLRKFPFVNNPDLLINKLKDNSHQIGATTMGMNASSAVVDKQLKVFGINNLYVTGTSVLPTGSHANPTLTALALSLRLTEKIMSI